MDGMTWNSEEVKELRRLRLDPIRNPPDRLRSLVEHFLKPGASVFAVTEGDGPVRVSKTLARKVRDLTTKGGLSKRHLHPSWHRALAYSQSALGSNRYPE